MSTYALMRGVLAVNGLQNMIELLNVESAKSGKITADEACRRVS